MRRFQGSHCHHIHVTPAITVAAVAVAGAVAVAPAGAAATTAVSPLMSAAEATTTTTTTRTPCVCSGCRSFSVRGGGGTGLLLMRKTTTPLMAPKKSTTKKATAATAVPPKAPKKQQKQAAVNGGKKGSRKGKDIATTNLDAKMDSNDDPTATATATTPNTAATINTDAATSNAQEHATPIRSAIATALLAQPTPCLPSAIIASERFLLADTDFDSPSSGAAAATNVDALFTADLVAGSASAAALETYWGPLAPLSLPATGKEGEAKGGAAADGSNDDSAGGANSASSPQVRVEYAASARSKCGVCLQPIAQASVRMGLSRRAIGSDVVISRWYHPACFRSSIVHRLSVPVVEDKKKNGKDNTGNSASSPLPAALAQARQQQRLCLHPLSEGHIEGIVSLRTDADYRTALAGAGLPPHALPDTYLAAGKLLAAAEAPLQELSAKQLEGLLLDHNYALLNFLVANPSTLLPENGPPSADPAHPAHFFLRWVPHPSSTALRAALYPPTSRCPVTSPALKGARSVAGQGKPKLVPLLAEYLAFGVPKPCDECGAPLRYKQTHYRCSGYADEFSVCGAEYPVERPRVPFFVRPSLRDSSNRKATMDFYLNGTVAALCPAANGAKSWAGPLQPAHVAWLAPYFLNEEYDAHFQNQIISHVKDHPPSSPDKVGEEHFRQLLERHYTSTARGYSATRGYQSITALSGSSTSCGPALAKALPPPRPLLSKLSPQDATPVAPASATSTNTTPSADPFCRMTTNLGCALADRRRSCLAGLRATVLTTQSAYETVLLNKGNKSSKNSQQHEAESTRFLSHAIDLLHVCGCTDVRFHIVFESSDVDYKEDIADLMRPEHIPSQTRQLGEALLRKRSSDHNMGRITRHNVDIFDVAEHEIRAQPFDVAVSALAGPLPKSLTSGGSLYNTVYGMPVLHADYLIACAGLAFRVPLESVTEKGFLLNCPDGAATLAHLQKQQAQRREEQVSDGGGGGAPPTSASSALSPTSTGVNPSAEKVIIVKDSVALDEHVPNAALYHVVRHSAAASRLPWQAMLSRTDMVKRTNSFYIMQLLCTDAAPHKYFVFRRWGRVGDAAHMDSQMTPASSLRQAETLFCKIFEEKTSNQWTGLVADFTRNGHTAATDLAKLFRVVPGKYAMLAVGEVQETKTDKGDNGSGKDTARVNQNPAIAKETESLLLRMFDTGAIERTLSEMKVDTKKLPLGNITTDTIHKGYAALSEILTVLQSPEYAKHYEGSSSAATPERESVRRSLMRLSSRFYTFIPHAISEREMIAGAALLDTQDKINVKTQLLDDLEQIAVTAKLLQQQDTSASAAAPATPQTFNPYTKKLTAFCESLKSQFIVIPPNDARHDVVNQYMQSTHGTTHSSFKAKINTLWELQRPHEVERMNQWLQEKKIATTTIPKATSETDDLFPTPQTASSATFVPPATTRNVNKMLLWHGSRFTNWVGVLSQGLRIAPPEAPVTGYMFGKGIYFADCFSKSANYCFVSRSSNGEAPQGLMALCEVAVGSNPIVRYNSDSDLSATTIARVQAQAHACFARGTRRPSHYSDVSAADLQPAAQSDSGSGGKRGKKEMESASLPASKQEDTIRIPQGPLKDSHSHRGSLQYNEFIVYDVSQVKIRYLLLVDFHF